jgi:WXG100 family type VII secretion target
MKIKVDTECLAATLNAVEGELADIRQNQSDLFQAMEALDSTWEGASHDAFVTQYTLDDQKMTTLCATIQTLTEHLRYAHDNYENCEQNVLQRIAAIDI